MRNQQAFDSPVVAAITLVQSHADKGPGTPNGSIYAQHRAAEVEAWAVRERFEPQNPNREFWAQTAVVIALDLREAAEHGEDEQAMASAAAD